MITIAPISTLNLLFLLLLILTALGSAFLYWRKARKLDAILVLCAALPLMVLLLQVRIEQDTARSFLLDSRKTSLSVSELQSALKTSGELVLQGDGLFASQWQDLPAKKLLWQRDTIPAGEILQLQFPQQLAYGRPFQLRVERRQNKDPWRVQLLAANQQILAEQKSTEKAVTLSWLPPVAERLVLQARVLDAADRVIGQGPIPVEIINAAPLQVQGRFTAASFDLQALNTLLIQSDAVLDSQTQLGKGIQRKEDPRLSMDKPNLYLQDAAIFEQLSAPARRQLLEQIATGATLLIVGANAQQPAVWSSAVGLRLRQAEPVEVSTAQGLTLSTTDLTPMSTTNSPWRLLQEEAGGPSLLAQRDWQRGKIVWLAVSNWHQMMISEPQKLKAWWQTILDAGEVSSTQPWQLEVDRSGQTMSLVGQRIALCGRGLESRMLRLPADNAEQGNRLQMQPVSYRAEAHCVAWWPASAGWHQWETDQEDVIAKDMQQAQGAVYVYDKKDWPTWQRHQKQRATEQYLQRLPEAVEKYRPNLVIWPFVLLSMLAFLCLWWREQRA
ncbi:hypothetical protein [Undibacterium sp.]|uniref:hypothetical protein n=1 Tax=Undibacterium sp. TaxID=1914977 RepID=UPI0037511EC3